MALVQCKECKAQISSSAKSCPQCGAKVKRTTMFTKVVGGFFALVIAVAIFQNIGADQRRAEQAKAEAARVASLTPEQKKAEAEAAAAKAAKKKVEDEAWARAQALADVVRKSANDPHSIEFSDAGYTDAGAVFLEFRGKNAFNATILNYAVATKDGKVAVGSKDKIATLWNANIANRTLYGLPKP